MEKMSNIKIYGTDSILQYNTPFLNIWLPPNFFSITFIYV